MTRKFTNDELALLRRWRSNPTITRAMRAASEEDIQFMVEQIDAIVAHGSWGKEVRPPELDDLVCDLKEQELGDLLIVRRRDGKVATEDEMEKICTGTIDPSLFIILCPKAQKELQEKTRSLEGIYR